LNILSYPAEEGGKLTPFLKPDMKKHLGKEKKKRGK